MKLIDKPAILGGKPLFRESLNFVCPKLPEASNLHEELRGILESGILTKGKYLEKFEEKIAEHLSVKHAIAVSSCTSGLMLAYQALISGGEVIVPSFTFMATVSSLVWIGAEPKFVDVELQTTNIDVEEVRSAIGKNTKAIVAVHNFGNPAEINELEAIAAEYDLPLIFDAAHGFGSQYKGKPLGSQGNVQIFSLSPTKLLIAGEGGVVATNNDELAIRIKKGREYGNDGNYNSIFAGMNARMPEFNALLAKHSLKQLEENVLERNRFAKLYRDNLEHIPGIEFQFVREDNRSSYKDFSIYIDSESFGLTRDQVAECLRVEGIDSRKYYHPSVHRQTAYKKFFKGDENLKNTELLAENSLSLPMGSHLNDAKTERICFAIGQIQKNADEIANKNSAALSGQIS